VRAGTAWSNGKQNEFKQQGSNTTPVVNSEIGFGSISLRSHDEFQQGLSSNFAKRGHLLGIRAYARGVPNVAVKAETGLV